MAVNSKHPLYSEYLNDWETVRDAYRGERIVKSKTTRYLPASSGMYLDGYPDPNTPGWKSYRAYLTRALFPDLVSDAVEAMIGVMHHKPPVIELPAVMEDLREKATLKGESLQMLLRRINEEQLVTGRLGILVDMPETPTKGRVLPYIAMYQAETILNWDQGRRDGIAVDNLNLVVLDETEHERTQDFEWESVEKYRVLVLGDPTENEPKGQGIYRAGVFRDNNATFNESALITPSIRGSTLDLIPFTFINSKDIVPDPDDPPLLGLANLVLAIYRGEGDYRQSLFMQGQDTLVVIGGSSEDEVRTGANSHISVPMGGDAKYIGVDSTGLSEQRSALENDYARASQKGGQLMDSVSRERESGDALKIRVAARTATLNQIALAGAFGLQSALRNIAVWIGADPEEVVVTPNLDFVDDTLNGKELVDLMTARQLGAPISLRSIHKLQQDKGLTEMDYEEEVSEIESEAPDESIGSTNPEGPEPDETEE